MRNSNIYRKINIIISAVYVCVLIVVTIMAKLKGISETQGASFWLRAVFCFIIGAFLFGKIVSEKDIYASSLKSGKYGVMIIILRIIGWLLFAGSIFIFCSESLGVNNTKIGSISSIIGTMLVLNVDSNFLKKE